MSTFKKSNGTSGLTPYPKATIWGDSFGMVGVAGTSSGAQGVQGISDGDAGVFGASDVVIGTYGSCRGDNNEDQGIGVAGYNGTDPLALTAVGLLNAPFGQSGVYGLSDVNDGVVGASNGGGNGVFGIGTDGIGVKAYCENYVGIYGTTGSGLHSIIGIVDPNNINADNANAGVFSNFKVGAPSRPGQYTLKYMQAADFMGHVNVAGNLFVEGTKGFKIDHPLDPANKTLKHSAVESSEMKTFYDGVARLDKKGRSVVKLPLWFCALNKDFRYQLTPIGRPSKNLYVASEIVKNAFTIGGDPNARVCWQVTATRKDAWANAYRMKVEERKSPRDRGRYSAPQLFPAARGKKLDSVLKSTMLDILKLQKDNDFSKRGSKWSRRSSSKRRATRK
jgi:hypothetical protein